MGLVRAGPRNIPEKLAELPLQKPDMPLSANGCIFLKKNTP
jgi:hypothetical protein